MVGLLVCPVDGSVIYNTSVIKCILVYLVAKVLYKVMLLPQSYGGRDNEDNLQCMCKPCNRSKEDDMSYSVGLCDQFYRD